ncbi:kinetochore protein Spc25-like [Erpetoichthys calabaricus]|uniref:Kinetochore protein SPC25 n=1 Tax=Erpetoichthys calabaricus TaxID=27687 RepID=A0A8C4T5B6_ERPCA|nr:kinetochore protein Spc25-like [Erpetoichthys calabaricus]
MAALKNPDVLDEVCKKIDECEKELDQFVLEYNNTMHERKQIYKENVQVATEQVLKKCTDCNLILERQKMNIIDCELMDVEREKKLAELSKLHSEISERENLKRELIKQIEHLREKQMEKKKALHAANERNKAVLKVLQKNTEVFRKVLALEIKRLHGEKLQFVFRNISHKDPDCPYTFDLHITEENQYEVTSCDPELEEMSRLERKLQDTNNFSAFLANVRQQFVALSEVRTSQ